MSDRAPVPNCRTAELHRYHSRKTNSRTSSASWASAALRQGAPLFGRTAYRLGALAELTAPVWLTTLVTVLA